MDPEDLIDRIASCGVDQYSNTLMYGRCPPDAVSYLFPEGKERRACPGDVMNAFCSVLPQGPEIPKMKMAFGQAVEPDAPSINSNLDLSLNPKFFA